ncbi:leucine-rich receptor-like protein kinase family protein [Striga asiatica]|uniref:Leucine-rich receptor-like protein kinase family protein n=1 Tax=Striga asiatica TaxID=4170 RepID=A0A5A7PQY8_STRAF|nr:leucine-rich receptor-like protein kinase family protein [Striga asiatica]
MVEPSSVVPSEKAATGATIALRTAVMEQGLVVGLDNDIGRSKGSTTDDVTTSARQSRGSSPDWIITSAGARARRRTIPAEQGLVAGLDNDIGRSKGSTTDDVTTSARQSRGSSPDWIMTSAGARALRRTMGGRTYPEGLQQTNFSQSFLSRFGFHGQGSNELSPNRRSENTLLKSLIFHNCWLCSCGARFPKVRHPWISRRCRSASGFEVGNGGSVRFRRLGCQPGTCDLSGGLRCSDGDFEARLVARESGRPWWLRGRSRLDCAGRRLVEAGLGGEVCTAVSGPGRSGDCEVGSAMVVPTGWWWRSTFELRVAFAESATFQIGIWVCPELGCRVTRLARCLRASLPNSGGESHHAVQRHGCGEVRNQPRGCGASSAFDEVASSASDGVAISVSDEVARSVSDEVASSTAGGVIRAASAAVVWSRPEETRSGPSSRLGGSEVWIDKLGVGRFDVRIVAVSPRGLTGITLGGPSRHEAGSRCSAVGRRRALHKFKKTITEDPSRLLHTWSYTTDCCTKWKGVSCDPITGRVVSLTRTGYTSDDDDSPDTPTMSGKLSPSLGNLTSLQLLDLSNLQFLSGPIPTELGGLANLTKIFLNNNNLTGPISSDLFISMTLLRIMDLSLNAISGPIPPSVGKLASLAIIDLHGNNFLGGVPESISGLGNLKYVDFSGNRLTGKIPESIGGLSSLKMLYLHGNGLTGKIPFSVGRLRSLQYLRLSENYLTGEIPRSIGNLTGLKMLSFESNHLSGKLPQTLGQLITLQGIYFSNNQFTGRIPSSLGNLTNIQELDLSRNQLSGPIPIQFFKLKQLQFLDLSFNPLRLIKLPDLLKNLSLSQLLLASTGLEGELPNSLSSFSSLSVLDLSSNSLKGTLPSWIGNLTKLSFLNLSNNSFNSSVPVEFKNLVRIADLDLHSNNLSGNLNAFFEKPISFPFGLYNSIDLSNNMFSGAVDNDIGNKPAMEFVDTLILSNNPLGGKIPETLGKLLYLTRLEMEKNELVGEIPKSLGNPYRLNTILLSGNGLSGGIPMEVLNNKFLKRFNVSDNRLSGEIPAHNVSIPASGFEGNAGLCGEPLPPCNKYCRIEPCHGTDPGSTLSVLSPGTGQGAAAQLERLLLDGNSLYGPIPGGFLGLKAGSVTVRLGTTAFTGVR